MVSGKYQEAAALNRRMRRVLAMFRRVAEYMADPRRNSEEHLQHLVGRIGAIGRAVLTPVSFGGIDLELLVRDEMLLHAVEPQRFSISGTDVRLSSKAGELMSLLVHELATNSVKYGALCQSHARITVVWQVLDHAGSRELRFEWLEQGVPLESDAPHPPGFGAALVQRVISEELRGEGRMNFLPDGVRCTIAIPLHGTRRRHG
jgi:two-component system CheB/CheR fusion protein